MTAAVPGIDAAVIASATSRSAGAERTGEPLEREVEFRVPPRAADAGPCLVVDLDGTLLQTNVLAEYAIAFVKAYPFEFFRLFLWLFKGRAYLKQQLARRVVIDTMTLPVNHAVAAYAVGQKERGRRVYLATAADQSIAEAVASQHGFFDGVLASDGRVNLKGARKAELLERTFPSGFAYMGDSRADFFVWAKAKEVVVVGEAGWAERTARRFAQPSLTLPTPSRLRALYKSARLHQWAKNALVFVPAILSGTLDDAFDLFDTILSFLAIGVIASSTYILNDLWDIADDRRHWSKRRRPLASGALPIPTALAAVPLGLALGFAIGWAAGPAVVTVLLAYLALTLGYSFAAKRVPVFDVTVLAGLFTVRLVLGIAAAETYASPWLLVFSMFLFSSLCFAKRYVEMRRSIARGQEMPKSRGYEAEDLPLVFGLGLATGTISIAVMVLYIMFDAFQRTFYGTTAWLWAFPLILFLWFCRIWLLAGRGKLDDDPVAFAVRDPASILLGVGMLIAFLLARS